VEQISRDARALRHPIQPESPAGPIDMVAADFGINRGMELDARHLGAGEQAADMDVVDDVAGHAAERAAQTADNAGLFAVRDGVVSDNVTADRGLIPAVTQSTFNGVVVCAGGC
jgi:hypothetical protein